MTITKKILTRRINEELSALFGEDLRGRTLRSQDAESKVIEVLRKEFGEVEIIEALLETHIHTQAKTFISGMSIGSVLARQEDMFSDQMLDSVIEVEGVVQKLADCNKQVFSIWEDRVIQNFRAQSAAWNRDMEFSGAVKEALGNDNPKLTIKDVWEKLQ